MQKVRLGRNIRPFRFGRVNFLVNIRGRKWVYEIIGLYLLHSELSMRSIWTWSYTVRVADGFWLNGRTKFFQWTLLSPSNIKANMEGSVPDMSTIKHIPAKTKRLLLKHVPHTSRNTTENTVGKLYSWIKQLFNCSHGLCDGALGGTNALSKVNILLHNHLLHVSAPQQYRIRESNLLRET
jgi:hypothetical protein